jgi:hypothetical protein
MEKDARIDVSAIMADGAVAIKSLGGFEGRMVEFVDELATVALAFIGFKFSGGHSWVRLKTMVVREFVPVRLRHISDTRRSCDRGCS